MGLLTTISNEFKAAIGYQKDFESLLKRNDVSRAIYAMQDHSFDASRNLNDYHIHTHEVMKRRDKAVFDKRDNFLRWQKRWRIPIPYQEYINEIALVFLYGRPVKWSQASDGTDEAFEKYKQTLQDVRFDAHVREAKRLAGAEGSSAILYHVYNENDKPRLLLNVLSKSNNDNIYTIRNQYRQLKAFGWGYYLTGSGGKSNYHVNIYTSHKIHYCKRAKTGWDVEVKDNPIGKIPVILFEQDPEHESVQLMIERYENKQSVDADVNDRFANPAMVATAEVLNSLPKQEEEAKLFILKEGGEINYLTWDQSSASKNEEYERLDNHILSKSFTPRIDFETMKGLSNVSGKALMQMMMPAVIKAERRKETHDGYMKRTANLMIAILGNVLDYKNKAKYDALKVTHEFQEPFNEDVSAILSDLLKQYEAGALSLETLLESSYLVKNTELELKRIKKDQADNFERQKELNVMDVFGVN
jgi:hypothetical protein